MREFVRHDTVLPTRVGMNRSDFRAGTSSLRSPHTRGDGPPTAPTVMGCAGFSPHAWGWPDVGEQVFGCFDVLPTRVGMARLKLV